MALLERNQTRKKLETALACVMSANLSSPPELTTAEIGLLHGFVLSQRVPGKSSQEEKIRVAKAQEAIKHWQEERADARPPSNAGKLPGQDIVDEIVLKVRLRRFDRLSADEIELARGTLEGLRACNYKAPLLKHLANALKHYEDIASDAESQIPLSEESLARRNAWAFLALALLLFPVAYQFLGTEENRAVAARLTPASGSLSSASAQERPHRLTVQERLEEKIWEYEERVSEDLESPEAPALRFALGNLHAKKRGDYEEAARHFELLLYDYPKWPNMRQVFSQLEYCYDVLGDESKREDLFREMKNRFPEDSREYKYAVSQLGYQ